MRLPLPRSIEPHQAERRARTPSQRRATHARDRTPRRDGSSADHLTARLPPTRRRLLRTATLASCLALIGWLWWDSQTADYAGLPVNTVGQILGDLLLMGLAPLAAALRRSRASWRSSAGQNRWADIAAARYRVQLLDIRSSFHGIAGLPPERAQREADDRRSDLLRALASALGNGARAEILLPDPDAASTARVAIDLAIAPDIYLSFLRALLNGMATLQRAYPRDRLELRLYASPAAVSMTRCDQRTWVYLNPPISTAEAYLAFDAPSANAGALQTYFNHLSAGARTSAYGVDSAAEKAQPQAGGPYRRGPSERSPGWNSGCWETLRHGTTANASSSEASGSDASSPYCSWTRAM